SRSKRFAANSQRVGLLTQRVVHASRRTSELVDQVELRLVVLGEPLFASTAELIEVLVLDRVTQADFVRASRLLLEGLRRVVESAVVSSANLVVPLPFLRNRSGTEVRHEGSPHLTDARTGRNDPARRRHGLEKNDLL